MKNFLSAFRYAGKGIILALRERNFRIHLLIFSLVITLGLYFRITKTEWLDIFLISALVLSLEMINSAIERACDLYTTEHHKVIEKIKDIAAGAVLVAALFAVAIGTLIFWKYIFPQ